MSASDGSGELLHHIRRRRRNLAGALAAIAGVAIVVVSALVATHAVEVVVEPADAPAALERKRGTLLTVGRRVFLYSSEGAITVRAEGFFRQDVALSRNAPVRRLPVDLEPRPGIVSLVVDSTEDFLVRVDGRIVGAEPALEVELPPGAHVVTIQGPRIDDIDAAVDVTGRGARQTFSFAPAIAATTPTVEFRVAAEPSFARILIDGVSVGTGRYRGPVAPGSRDIAVEADNYAPDRRKVEIPPHAEVTDIGTISLSPLPASVSIRSSPPGATVLVDGEYRGDTPLQLGMDAGREHRLSIRKSGFRSADEVLHPLPNARIQRSYNLAATSYRADVTTNIPAEIAVNGRVVGAAPLQFEVRDNDEITAVAPGFEARPVRVRPGGGAVRRYAFELLTPAQFAYRSASPEATAPAGIHLRRFAPVRFEAGESDNTPPAAVELSRAFYFAVHETTVAAVRAFDPGFAPGRAEDLPAVSVTWQDAAKFCNWLSARAGLAPAYVFGGAFARLDTDSLGFRLPTEAEWEAVARYDFAAGRVRGSPHPWGASPAIPRAFNNLAGRELRADGVPFLRDHVDNHRGVAPVGSYPANFNGIHDLAGNVSEWVNDYYRTGPFAPDSPKDPLGPYTGTDHVVRGANHLSADRAALSAGYRTLVAHRSATVGFRVARWIH